VAQGSGHYPGLLYWVALLTVHACPGRSGAATREESGAATREAATAFVLADGLQITGCCCGPAGLCSWLLCSALSARSARPQVVSEWKAACYGAACLGDTVICLLTDVAPENQDCCHFPGLDSAATGTAAINLLSLRQAPAAARNTLAKAMTCLVLCNPGWQRRVAGVCAHSGLMTLILNVDLNVHREACKFWCRANQYRRCCQQV